MSRLALADLLLRDPAALLILKATVVLALVAAAALAAKNYSAARRHMLWLVALLSCVWLVVSSPLVPAITIHTPMLSPSAAAIVPRLPVAKPTPARDAAATNTARERPTIRSSNASSRSPVRPMPLPSHPFIALWMIGCVALLARHAAGFIGTARLARRATIASDEETVGELAGIAAAVGVKREVRLGYSAQVRSPITFDALKPYVLLPIEALSWPSDRRRAVLVHEMAHIARGDWLSQAIGQIACELFWFHPLMWHAFARLRDEAERAADDYVLRSGMPACDYAAQLLALAERTVNRPAIGRRDLVAIGIVSAGDLERRFVAMFDDQRSRTLVTRRARTITASFALAMMCPLASLRVAAPSPHHFAPLPSGSFRRAMPPRVPMTQPPGAAPSATRASESLSDNAGASAMPEVRAQAIGPAIAHPDFSGTWMADTMADPLPGDAATDSCVIRQSPEMISFDTRGHYEGLPTHNIVRAAGFDSAPSSGVVATGDAAMNVVASAVWVADTLVLKTYAQSAGHDALTYERMTLSADGNTMYAVNTSFVDGRNRWGGPRTFVLRRKLP